MPVDTPKPAYAKALDKWARCRDCHDGQDAIKAKRTAYLPLLEGHKPNNDPAYERYLLRALFYNGTGRTVEALSGAVFRKPPAVDVPEKTRALESDVTMTGQSLTAFAATIIDELLTTGRAGLLVDYADVKATGMDRPYARMYKAEQIINWHAPYERGARILRLVVLREEYEGPTQDEFVPECLTQYRVLRLTGEGEAARVDVRVFRQAPASAPNTDQRSRAFAEVADMASVLSRRGVPLTFIPFVFLPDVEIEKPPLLDLADVNLSLYRTSADHEHGLHFTALPTPWVVGAPQNAELAIGSGVAWVLDNTAHSKADMLEFKGQGLDAVRDAMEDKKKMMAVLGARLLEEQPATQETATAVGQRHAGEMSVLQRLTLAASSGLTQVMTWLAWWAGHIDAAEITADITVKLNMQFLPANVDPTYLQAMNAALDKNSISPEVFWHALLRLDAVPEGWTFEDERKAIAAAVKEKSDRMVAEGRALTAEDDGHASGTTTEDDDPSKPPLPGDDPEDEDADAA